MAPVPDVPPAICQPAPVAKPAAKPVAKPAPAPSGKAEEARQTAVAKYGETLFYRAGDDLFAFPVRYALAPPELGLLGCVIRSRETAFAFPLSDMAAAMAAHAATPGVAPPRKEGDPAPDDPTIRVTAFYLGPHPDFAGMTKTIASVRREDKRQGFLNDLERFPAAGGDYLVRISEDRGVLARLPGSPDAADARAQLWFQTPVWSAVVEVPASALPRWDTIHAAIDAFVAEHLAKGYFKR
ncbi:hypothetical protein V5F72_21930 [Xanthobacter flavus]|uniref:hypothetical protein n=1 Tax=Xanthobacter flavus TaxID=281 RepID=UPI00372C6512